MEKVIHELNIFLICLDDKDIFKTAKMTRMGKYLTCSVSFKKRDNWHQHFHIFQIIYIYTYMEICSFPFSNTYYSKFFFGNTQAITGNQNNLASFNRIQTTQVFSASYILAFMFVLNFSALYVFCFVKLP